MQCCDKRSIDFSGYFSLTRLEAQVDGAVALQSLHSSEAVRDDQHAILATLGDTKTTRDDTTKVDDDMDGTTTLDDALDGDKRAHAARDPEWHKNNKG